MAITKLTVENFKSFDKLEVELRPFNIVIGSNASGKSNFLDVFRFLRDIADDSLESAIGIRGGGEALRNFNLDDTEVMRIFAETDGVLQRLVPVHQDGAIGLTANRWTYDLLIQFNESNTGFKVVGDEFAEYFTMLELHSAVDLESSDTTLLLPSISSSRVWEPFYTEQQKLGSGRVLYHRKGDSINRFIELSEDIPLSEKDIAPAYDLPIRLNRPQEVLLERSRRSFFLLGWNHSLTNISTYDFDPNKSQQAVPITGLSELESDAENLSVVLREILRRPESNKRLINLVSELLPFVRDLEVEEFGFGQLITTLTERFSDKGRRLPAAFASDGTIACLALVVALHFQDSAVAIFEEPDRYIHPHLAGRIMQLMNEVTDDKQVIITTHNPELLRHANLEDILLVSRDGNGHSQVTRPANSEVVRHFLQSELGVEDLFTQDLLAL